jgi:hypothetical protein
MKGIFQQLIDKGAIPELSKNKYKNYSDVQNKARGMKKGGTASARADGIAIRGKTKA